MSGTNVSETEVCRLIRLQLNSDQVKLWLEPYTTTDGQRGEATEQLINNYCLILKLPRELVEGVIENLRQHSLQKFYAIENFRKTGIATLKVSMTGSMFSHDRVKQYVSGESESGMMLEINLEANGLDLKCKVSLETGISSSMLKLIANGCVVDDNMSLVQQNIKNLTQVLVLCLSTDEVEAIKSDTISERVTKTREVAQMVASYEGDDDNVYQLQIADQNGKVLEIPTDEKKALTLAMMLHQKGSSALKRKETSLSLVYFLEAEKEFKKCHSGILEYVDNYGLLCLDIVWCYLQLQNISALPDAEDRLKTCEQSFRKSYGQNLERLKNIKGGTGKEQALLMRLYLLQAILAFHQGMNQICNEKLKQAESELVKLHVDEDSMRQVMEMGFSSSEARLSLRASGGNVAMALAHIVEQREEKAKMLKKEKEEKEVKQLEKKLGKTASGQQVNIYAFKMLLKMGFPKGASAEALRQTNNNLTQALQVIQERPELLSLPDPDPPSQVHITDEMIQQVMMLGFDQESVRAALYHFGADVNRCIEKLLECEGLALPEWFQSIPQFQSPSTPSTSSSDGMSASNTSISSSDDMATAEESEKANRERARLIEEELVPDMPENEEDHLDLELEDETQFLEEYKARLASVL